jgi:hypothetical protein
MPDVNSSDKFSIFFPITKAVEQDDGTVMVWGRGTEEVLDGAREIMDYASTKPLIEKWSSNVFDRSGGLSKGNIRAMHQPIAAGVLKELNFLDDQKAVDLCAHVIDENEVKKVKAGVYTGFSMGGNYMKRWADSNMGGMRFTGNPTEWSLVDAPCVRSATFQMVKADGLTVDVPFAEKQEIVTALDAEHVHKFIDAVEEMKKMRQEDLRKIEKQELAFNAVPPLL